MKKQLLIIVYKINIHGLTHQQVNETMNNCIERLGISKDEELKDDYIIREMFLPIQNGDNDIQVIYPQVLSDDSYKLIKEINKKIDENIVNDEIKKYWNKLLRELKMINLEI